MDDRYHPSTCNHSVDLGGTYVCEMAVKPCALHFSERCYMKQVDDAFDNLTKALIKELKESQENTG